MLHQVLGLTQIKTGHKGAWLNSAMVALVLGLGAIGLQLWQLLSLPFFPGIAGFASVFLGATPVFVIVVMAAMIWLETLIMRARVIPPISFVEQPPTYAAAFDVHRLQSRLI